MPTYDYVCDNCGDEFELFQSITEPVKKKCTKCKKSKLRRKFGTGAAIMFKGSGFYTTDYRSENYKKQASADQSAASSASENKSESKSESKPADSKPAESKSESKSSGSKSSKKD